MKEGSPVEVNQFPKGHKEKGPEKGLFFRDGNGQTTELQNITGPPGQWQKRKSDIKWQNDSRRQAGKKQTIDLVASGSFLMGPSFWSCEHFQVGAGRCHTFSEPQNPWPPCNVLSPQGGPPAGGCCPTGELGSSRVNKQGSVSNFLYFLGSGDPPPQFLSPLPCMCHRQTSRVSAL